MEICNTACDNHAANNELCAKNIKVQHFKTSFKSSEVLQEVLDKKFGPSWHVIVGEGFGFEISYETKKMFYMFSAGECQIESVQMQHFHFCRLLGSLCLEVLINIVINVVSTIE